MNDTILVADSNNETRNTLKAILETKYNVLEAADCSEAFDLLRSEQGGVDAVIFSLPMCSHGDMGMLEGLKRLGLFDNIPVFAICEMDERGLLLPYFEAGMTDIIIRPFNGAIVLQKLQNFIGIYTRKRDAERLISEQTRDLQAKNKLLVETNGKIIELLGNVVEARSMESGAHIRRVKSFTKVLADDVKEHYPQYGLTDKMVADIASASAMHDIGKILIPDSILLKPARRTEEEYEVMKTHTLKGSELLESARDIWGDEYANICKDIALYHHERYDGNGYPCGLKGDEIPISAQIVSIADVYDALVTQRVYKEPYSPEEAYDMIVTGKCGKFSDLIIECFKRQSKNLADLLR